MKTPLLPRGVWAVPWRGPKDERFVVAVNRQGQCVFQARVFRNDDERAVVRMLRRLLDGEDPPR